jgi:hypothetical protein
MILYTYLTFARQYKKMRTLSFLLLFTSLIGKAQTPFDGELMAKKQVCLAGMATRETWSKYWEDKTLITNQNIGQFTRQSIGGFLAYGFNDRLNIIATIPFARTSFTNGTVKGNQGLQDASLFLKYKLLSSKLPATTKIFAVIGGSMPASNYNEDAGALSIGLGSPEINGRLTIDMGFGNFFIRPQISYHKRFSSTLDRNSYYDGQIRYTNIMDIPDMVMPSATFGVRVLKSSLRIEGSYLYMNTIGGTHIRRYEVPLANANSDAQMVQGLLKYDPNFLFGFGFQAIVNHTLTGRNVGQGTGYNLALTFRHSFNNKKNNASSTPVEPVTEEKKDEK